MQGLRRFLSPGWVIGLLAVIAFAYACFALLAPWQLGKSDDLDARNARLTESVQAAPAPLAEVASEPSAFVEREWRLVTLDGTWQPDAEALLRLRSVDGEPVYQVLTVFRADDGREYLVNRGHVPVGENNTVPDYPTAPEGTVGITARLRATEAGQAEPVIVDGRQTVRVVDPAVIGGALDHDLVAAGYLQLSADQPGSLTPAPVPGIENGPYFSYGLQWLAFGILAPIGLAYFAWSEIRTRRRVAAEQAGTGEEVGTDGGPGTDRGDDDEVRTPSAPGDPDATPDRTDPAGPAASDEAPESDAVLARERALQSRYGTRHDAERRRAFKRGDRLRS